MARRLPTMIVPESATIPNNTITAPEWTQAKSEIAVAYDEAQLSQTRTYDTRAFATIQDAIDTAYANGGGTVFLADSELAPQTLTLRDGVYLTGRGIGATVLKVHSVVGSGSLVELPGLGSNVVSRDRTVTFSGAHGLVPGDVFIIHDTNTSSFSSYRDYYQAGEFCRVIAVAGNTVRLSRPIYGGDIPTALAYTTGAHVKIYKMVPIRTGVSNMTVQCTTGQYGIRINLGMDLEFSNLAMSGTDVAHIGLSRCYKVSISRVSAFDVQAAVGLNYGITVMNCQRVTLDNVDLETTRHGLTISGDAQPAAVPNRDIRISNSYINGLSEVLGVCGANVHGNSEHIEFSHCTLPSGVNPAGDHFTMSGCKLTTPPWGSGISSMEMLGTTLTIADNVFYANDDHDQNRGMLYFLFGTGCTRTRGVFTFEGNTVNLGAAVSNGVTANCMYILVQSSVGSTRRRLYIRNNSFESETNLDNRRAVRIRDDGADHWDYIDYTNNTGGIGTIFRADETPTLVLFDGWGIGIPDFAAQRGSRYMRRATAGTDTGRLYVNQNGDTNWSMK